MKEISFRNDVLPLKDKLFRMALRITLNRQEAEDVVQDTLVKVWKLISKRGGEPTSGVEEAEMRSEENGKNGKEGMREIESVEALSMTICRNLSLDRKALSERRNVSFSEAVHDRADISAAPDERLIRSEGEAMVENLLNSLPEKQRTAMQLREIEGKSYAEIAKVMNISEADVKINIFRARKKMKELFNNLNEYGL